MGRGRIISGGETGLYQVEVKYNTDRVESDIAALNKKIQDLAEPIEEKTIEVADKQAELDVAVAELTALGDEFEVLVGELDTLRSQLDVLDGELVALNEQLKTFEENLRLANIQLEVLNAQLVVLEAELQELIDEGAPPAEIAAKEAEIVLQEQAISLQETNIQTIEDQISDQNTLISEKEIEISDKQTEMSDKTAEIEENIKEQEELFKEANTLALELSGLELELDVLELKVTAYEKKIQFYEDNTPEDETVSAWCADLTEDLSGNVGTIEVPGERAKTSTQIQPGWEENAVYDQERDGQLFPTISATPAMAFYNLAMMPGWQKWNPTFKYGTLTAITDNTADVTLEDIKSSQQDLSVNKNSTLSDVEIDYMSCHGDAFEIGDEVLIMFVDQDNTKPKIIGFREDPKTCEFIHPYLFASENSFDSGGILLCLGSTVDLDTLVVEFTEPHELFSPYGETSYVDDWWYQPYSWVNPEMETEIIEWQVKGYTDPDTDIFYDEVKWMSSGGFDWDPTFYETFEDSFEIEKPYDFETVTVTERGGEFPPEFCTWNRSITVSLIDNVLASASSIQYFTGDPGEGEATWFNSGDVINTSQGSLDQTDPTKYGLIYAISDFFQTGPTLVGGSCIINGDLVYSNQRIFFTGLGHTREIPGWTGSAIQITNRLYNIEGRYICLFSIHAGDMKVIGSAVEGGEFTIVDVSDGFLVDGELKDLFTGTRSNTLGLISKGGKKP